MDRAKRKSITWLECEKAKREGKDVLAFIADGDYPWREDLREDYALTEAVRKNKATEKLWKDTKWRARRLNEFKEWLLTAGTCEKFTTPEDLRGKVEGALWQWRLDHRPAVSGTDHYLLVLRHDTSHIDIRGLQVASGTTQRFPIDDLYIPLKTVLADEAKGPRLSRRGREVEQAHIEERKPIELQGALKHPKLVILGDPGAGKTTFLRRIAYGLCNSRLGLSDTTTAQTLGLREQPFPILIRTFELVEHIDRCAVHAQGDLTEKTSPAWLAHFLATASVRAQTGLERDFFDNLLATGPAMVLVDGLDEAPTTKHRENIAALVMEAARRFGNCRFVVTSRPPAYTGKAVLADFAHAWIDPLEDEAIKGFLMRWCRALFNASEKQSLEHCEELLKVIQGRVEIRRIARNPVMLTALTVVHWHEKRLPEQRADLYESIITWLSRSRKRWEGRLAPEVCVSRLQELGLAMQNAPEGRQVQVSRRWAAEQIAAEWTDGSEPKLIEAADTFLREDEMDSGILVSRGDDVRFWHLTFQEFLAARAIAARSEKDQKTILLSPPDNPILYQSPWREVVLLLAGVLYKQGYRKVDTSFSAVLEGACGGTLADEARCAGLLGAAVRDLGAAGYRPADPRYQELLDRVMGIFDAERAQGIDIKVIIQAAEALGQASDPRFTDAVRADNWVTIPAGAFLMGAQRNDRSKSNYDAQAFDDEAPVHSVSLEAYRIGRYPVTVGEYLRFVEAGGYEDENKSLWTAGGFGKWQEPDAWQEQLDHLTRPVTGVSWYEAAAYAAWSGCRLPTEAEWEKAARGPQGRRYPWGGEEPDSSRMNYGSNVGCPTPVGVYARGATPDGILDLAGNVWEWCNDWFGAYAKTSAKDPEGPSSGSARVLRGGSWGYGPRRCRGTCRYGRDPLGRGGFFGFRLVSPSVGLGHSE